MSATTVFILVLATAVAVGYVVLYRRWSPRPPRVPPEYLTHPPADLPPALVGALFDSTPGPNKIAATLLDLVSRGVIEMQDAVPPPGGDDRWLQLRRERMKDLEQFEQEFIYEIFDHIGKGDRVRTTDVRAWWRAHPATSGVVEALWSVRLRQDMILRGLRDPRASQRRRVLSMYSTAVIVAVGLLFLVGPPALLFLSLGFLMQLWTTRYSGVTPRGVELASQYGSFRHYLDDYGRFRDKPADSVVVWGEYLPLAVVLGLGAKAAAEVRLNSSLADPMTWARGSAVADPFPDEEEARIYLCFRAAYDLSLPSMRVWRGKNARLVFDPPVDTAPALGGPWGRVSLDMRQRPLRTLLVTSPFTVVPALIAVAWMVFV